MGVYEALCVLTKYLKFVASKALEKWMKTEQRSTDNLPCKSYYNHQLINKQQGLILSHYEAN